MKKTKDINEELRLNLTVALRFAEKFNFSEGICNHFSCELGGNSEFFLINPQGLHWSEIHPTDLMIVNKNNYSSKGYYKIEKTAMFIHKFMHDILEKKCVFHTHMPHSTCLTLLKNKTLDVYANQGAMRFYDRIQYQKKYNGLIVDEDSALELIKTLDSKKDVFFLQNHGIIVCGNNVHQTFDDLYYLERACMIQNLAQNYNSKFRRVPKALVKKTAKMFSKDKEQSFLHFEALKRKLIKENPELGEKTPK